MVLLQMTKIYFLSGVNHKIGLFPPFRKIAKVRMTQQKAEAAFSGPRERREGCDWSERVTKTEGKNRPGRR